MSNRFVICIRNDDYAASLELRKLYECVEDPHAAASGQVRIIDESGEDYLYPEDFFIAVDLPGDVAQTVAGAA